MPSVLWGGQIKMCDVTNSLPNSDVNVVMLGTTVPAPKGIVTWHCLHKQQQKEVAQW